MGRHTKLEAPADGVDDVGLDPEELLRRTIRHLTKLLGAVERTLEAGEANPALARESASVARAMTSLAAELRAREKHEKSMVEAMTPEERRRVVFAFVRELDNDGRAEMRAVLDELDSSERLLG